MEILGHQISRAILRCWLGFLGRWHYRCGLKALRLEPAERAFRKLVEIDGSSYVAHLHLGLIAHALGRRQPAEDELGIAYRLQPRRFRRAPVPARVMERVLWRESVRGGIGLVWRSLDGTNWSRVADAAAVVGDRTQPGLAPRRPPADMPARSDFSSYNEFVRISSMPPITPEEIAQTDADYLMRRLIESD